jgi:folate-binding protein YgfZ
VTVRLARPDRDVVAITGPDARSFLQSLLSQDLDPLGDGDAAHSLLLTPQGKLDVEFVVLRVADEELWLVCEGGFGGQLVASLSRFKIRVHADIVERPDLTVLAVRGTRDVSVGPAAHVIPARWSGEDAVDVVGPPDAVGTVESELVAAGAADVSADEYEVLRMTAGVPRQGHDIDEKTIPQEAFLERDAVSFTKGCFMGQELVCRIDTRGHVNRYLRRLQTPTGAEVPRGAEIVVDDRIVGNVTSAGEGVALATVRHEVEPPATVTIRWAATEVAADLLN